MCFIGYVLSALSWSAGVFVIVSAANFNVCMREEEMRIKLMKSQNIKHISEMEKSRPSPPKPKE